MKTHILIIDPLQRLSIKKDSSLLLALALKTSGQEVFILMREDLFFQNTTVPQLQVFPFQGKLYKDDFYIKDFQLLPSQSHVINNKTVFHMRLDPPFDLTYLRTLWLLQALKMYGVQVVNDSQGVLTYNEKLVAYSLAEKKFPSYLGESVESLKSFLKEQQANGVQEVILKPVDMFQGLGVEKRPLDIPVVVSTFLDMKKQFNGAVIVQPFAKSVAEGEIRAVFFDGQELGSILKIPPHGSHLANIAQGAHYKPITLNADLLDQCQKINSELLNLGVRWTAFDILDQTISEVNITCPGLLVETSIAHNKNLALEIVQQL